MVERLRSELPDPPAARIARLGAELDLERALVLVTGGLDRLYEATVAAGAERIAAANVIANNLVGAGVDPEAVSAEELAALVGARDRIPRQVFDEAIAKSGATRASAPRRISRRRRSPTHRSSTRSSTRSSRRTPARWRPSRAARTASSASSSAR